MESLRLPILRAVVDAVAPRRALDAADDEALARELTAVAPDLRVDGDPPRGDAEAIGAFDLVIEGPSHPSTLRAPVVLFHPARPRPPALEVERAVLAPPIDLELWVATSAATGAIGRLLEALRDPTFVAMVDALGAALADADDERAALARELEARTANLLARVAERDEADRRARKLERRVAELEAKLKKLRRRVAVGGSARAPREPAEPIREPVPAERVTRVARRLFKLRRDPERFFADSRHPLARRLGRLVFRRGGA